MKATAKLNYGNSTTKVTALRWLVCLSAALWLLALSAEALAQSGRNPVSGRRTISLNVIATRVDDPNKPKPLLAGSGKRQEAVALAASVQARRRSPLGR